MSGPEKWAMARPSARRPVRHRAEARRPPATVSLSLSPRMNSSPRVAVMPAFTRTCLCPPSIAQISALLTQCTGARGTGDVGFQAFTSPDAADLSNAPLQGPEISCFETCLAKAFLLGAALRAPTGADLVLPSIFDAQSLNSTHGGPPVPVNGRSGLDLSPTNPDGAPAPLAQ